MQQTRQEVIYVKTGVPFFFKGERLAVEIKGREVTIWRPTKLVGSKDTEARDIIFVGSVSSTEMVRKAIVGPYASPDPAVLTRIVPVYATTGATSSGSNGAAPGNPANGGAK